MIQHLLKSTDYLYYRLKELLEKIMQKKSKRFLFKSLFTKCWNEKFNVLIDGKSFFDWPVKNRDEAYEKIIETNDYTTGNILVYEYFSNNYKLIAIYLSKQIELEDPDLKQQVNFIGKLEGQDNGTRMFFITEKSQEATCEFSEKSVSII